MQEQQYQLNSTVAEQREVSGVLRNTYGLLALTLAFSGLVAYVSQQMRLPYPNVFVVLIGFYGLFFLTVKLRNSAWGLVSTFALTGFMGYTLGPILNMYLGLPNGGSVITSAFAMTALVFFGLSAYVLTTRKDMSFLSGFITAGFFVLLGGIGHGDAMRGQAFGEEVRPTAVPVEAGAGSVGDRVAERHQRPRCRFGFDQDTCQQ